METLLVGVENTDEGRDALRFAKSIAEATGAKIHAVCVEPTVVYYLGEGDMEEVRASYFSHARRVVEEELGEDFEFHELVEMSPASGISITADSVDADLVVVGSCHRGPIGRVLMGDTTALLVAGSTRPVAVVPRGTGKARSMERIGIGFDGSSESQQAAAFAEDLARTTGSRLRLIGVVTGLMPVGHFAMAYVNVQDSLREKMEEALTGKAVQFGDIPVETEVREGITSDQLVIASDHLDLLVLGSRGYGAAKRVLLGSTSLPVMRGASCPVVVVPRGED